MSVPPRTRYFLSKLSSAIANTPLSLDFARWRRAGVDGARPKRFFVDCSGGGLAEEGRLPPGIVCSICPVFLCVRTFQPVEPVGAEQYEVNQQREREQKGKQRNQSPARDRTRAIFYT